MPASAKIPEALEGAGWWERLAAVGSVLLLAVVAWLVARLLLADLRAPERVGLAGLDRLAAPLALLVAVGAGAVGLLPFRPGELPLVESVFGLLAIAGAFWLLARGLDVAWATGRRSARLRADPTATAALLAGRRVGKAALLVLAAVVLAIRLGAAGGLYVALGAAGAALAFAARDPIRNAFAFLELTFDPPFHLGDRVRLVELRGGEACVGEVVRIGLLSTSIRTGRRTRVTLANATVLALRIENLSLADRRRLELAVPIAPSLSADELRAACDAIEGDLDRSPFVTDKRRPRVWISGFGEGLRLEAFAWLRRAADRRDAQRELLLGIRGRLDRASTRSAPPEES